jgi:hypothetical protein
MKKEKKYHRVFFDPNSFEKIFSEFQNIVSDPSKTQHSTLKIKRKGEGWEYDTFEEYISEIRINYDYSVWAVNNPELRFFLLNNQITGFGEYSELDITSQSRDKIIRL